MSLIKSHVQCDKIVNVYIAVGFHGFKLGVNGTYPRLVSFWRQIFVELRGKGASLRTIFREVYKSEISKQSKKSI